MNKKYPRIIPDIDQLEIFLNSNQTSTFIDNKAMALHLVKNESKDCIEITNLDVQFNRHGLASAVMYFFCLLLEKTKKQNVYVTNIRDKSLINCLYGHHFQKDNGTEDYCNMYLKRNFK